MIRQSCSGSLTEPPGGAHESLNVRVMAEDPPDVSGAPTTLTVSSEFSAPLWQAEARARAANAAARLCIGTVACIHRPPPKAVSRSECDIVQTGRGFDLSTQGSLHSSRMPCLLRVLGRRFLWLAVVSTALTSMVGPAWADAQFGSRFLQRACCTLYGTRAEIDLVGLAPDKALAAARVEAYNAGSYLIQAGYIKSKNIGWANCPNVSSRHRFYEALTPSGTHCNAYSNTTGGMRAAVVWRTDGPTIWRAGIDASAVFQGPVGFGEARGLLAGDEMNGSGSMTARFGTPRPWQRAQGKNGCCYYTIQESWVFRRPSDAWTIGSLPSPFTISGP